MFKNRFLNKINNIMQMNCNSDLTEKFKYTKWITGSRLIRRTENTMVLQYRNTRNTGIQGKLLLFWSMISLSFCIVFCCFLFVLVFFLFVLCFMPQCYPCLCIVFCLFWFFFSSFCALCPNVARVSVLSIVGPSYVFLCLLQ